MALRSDRRLKQADKVFLDRHALSLSSAPCTQTPRGSYSLPVCVCVCTRVCVVGGCSSGLGLEHICVCACLSVCTFPCVVLNAWF